MVDLRALSFKAAGFSFMIARAPSFEGRCFTDEYPGKTCLNHSHASSSCWETNDYPPVPLYQELLNALLLIRIFKVIHNAVIECFGISRGIGLGKNGGRAKCKLDLGLMVGVLMLGGKQFK